MMIHAGMYPVPYMTMIGSDGAIHVVPLNEEHDAHYGCVCNPIQTVLFAGGAIFTHRMLSC